MRAARCRHMASSVAAINGRASWLGSSGCFSSLQTTTAAAARDGCARGSALREGRGWPSTPGDGRLWHFVGKHPTMVKAPEKERVLFTRVEGFSCLGRSCDGGVTD